MSTTRSQSRAMAIPRGRGLPPEVLDMILSELPPHSLQQCALANREFGQIATSLLWHVHATPGTTTKTQDPAYRQSLIKNAQHIQYCAINSEKALDIFCPAATAAEVKSPPPPPPPPIELPNLQKLEIDIRQDHISQIDEARILSWFPRLSISSLCIKDIISPTMAFAIAQSDQLRLTEISLRSELTVTQAAFLLSKLPSQVQDLSLSFFKTAAMLPILPDEEKKVRSISFTTTHHALRSLSIHALCERNAYDYFLVPFLATCSSNLKTFNGDRTLTHANLNVRRALDKLGIHAIKFNCIHLKDMQIEDKEIAENIKVSTRLKDVSLEDLRHVGYRTVAALIGLADTLTFLNLPNYGSISGADVVQMLSSLRSLKSFHLHAPSNRWNYGEPDPLQTTFLTAAEFLSFEWATSSLEFFMCPIKVPRPEAHVPEEYRNEEFTCEDETESWAIQRQVYRQFAKQVFLFGLYLGISTEFRKWSPQWYSLEMTLESGLDELGKLRSLRALGISGLNHSMTTLDCKWIYDKWGFFFRLNGEQEPAKEC